MPNSIKKLNSLKICLKHGISGLTIEWYNVDQRSHKSFMLISVSATKGQVFETYLSSKILSLLPKSFSTSNLHIISCDSGEVILVSLGNIGNYTQICHSQGNIIWANFINDCFAIVERSGRISLGTFGNQIHLSSRNINFSLKWRSVSLSLTPVSCTGLENILILCDGCATYLYEIKNDPSQELTNKLQRLSFCGIVQIERNGLQVCLSTYYGKKYIHSLESLQENARNGVKVAESLHFPDFYLDNAMKAIKRFSETSKTERAELEKVNCYLEQISIAQMLLSDSPSKLFCVVLSVSNRSVREGYFLSITLKQLASHINFRSPWWRLNVKLKGCPTISCGYGDCNHQNASFIMARGFELTMPIPFSLVQKLVSNCHAIMNLEFYLTFSHFSLQKPLCVLKIQEEPLDILYFLTSRKNSTLPPLFTSHFATKVSKMFDISRELTPFVTQPETSYYKTFLLLREKHIPLLEKLFPELFSSQNQIASLTQWLQDIRLNLTLEKVKGPYYKVTIESVSNETAVAVKCALERRALENFKNLQNAQNEEVMKLPMELCRKAQVMNVILNLETSPDNMPESTLRTMYNSVVDLISNVPL